MYLFTYVGIIQHLTILVKCYIGIIWMNVLSLTATMIIWNCSRKPRSIAPPHSSLKIANRINSIFCSFPSDKSGPSYLSLEVVGSDDHPVPRNQKRSNGSWDDIFRAVNNFINAADAVIYIILTLAVLL